MNISVKEASQVTGWSAAYIRSACRRGVIGDGWSGGRGERITCVVSPGKLAEFMGITREELEDEVSRVRWKNLQQRLYGAEK